MIHIPIYIPASFSAPVTEKLLERVVTISSFCFTFSLNPVHAGFHPNYATETALNVKVTSFNITKSSSHFSVLISCDLSAAFNTDSHTLLFETVSPLRFHDTVFPGFPSLSGCCSVSSGFSSSALPLDVQEPQGLTHGAFCASVSSSPIA